MPPVDNDRHNNSNNNIIIHDRHDHRASNSVVLDIPERDTVTRPVMSEASDINLLHRSVADAGRWAFGMILVEVWVMSPDNTALYRSDSGWWIDPVYHRNCSADCKICRLTEPSRTDYLAPHPLAPGEGLQGALWSETGYHLRGGNGNSNSSSFHNQFLSRDHHNKKMLDGVFGPTSPIKQVVWREVQALADDPDQPWNPRLQLLAEVGLGWAAAVPFRYHGQQGIVVYLARQGVDQAKLQSVTNET
jgi:hypothetical protein